MIVCEKCNHFVKDCNIDGSLFYFCDLIIKDQKDLNECLLYNDDEDLEREKLTFKDGNK